LTKAQSTTKLKTGPDGYYAVSVKDAGARMAEIDRWLVEQANMGVVFRPRTVWADFQIATKSSDHALIAELRWG
jgi:hypothetical protein